MTAFELSNLCKERNMCFRCPYNRECKKFFKLAGGKSPDNVTEHELSIIANVELSKEG